MPGLLDGIHFCEHTFIFNGIFGVIINDCLRVHGFLGGSCF